MQSFILSAALAFIVYEFLAYTRPPSKYVYTFTVGEISVRFGRTSALLARYVFLAALASAFLFFALGLHRYSPFHNVNIALGFVCGPMLGIWLNSILRLPPSEGLRRGQILGGIGLVILCFLGSVGNEGAELIRRYAKHISSLKFGVAEFSFVEKNRGDTTPGSPSNPPPDPRSSGRGPANNFSLSRGLQYASQLGPWFIERDIQYLGLFKASDDRFEATRKLSAEVIEPPLGCLADWSQTAADSASIEPHLRAYAGIFRYLHDLGNDAHRKKFVDDFVNQSQALASDAELFAASRKDSPCRKLQSITSASAKEDVGATPKDEFEERPYFAILHASLLAQLGQYQASGAILDDWLINKTSRKNTKNWKAADDWFELRARSVLAAYTEEWIGSNEASVTTELRNEHLKNMDILRAGLRRLFPASGYFATLLDSATRQSAIEYITPGVCRYRDEDASLWRKLFTSYITIEVTYDQNTLLYPIADYDANYAEETTDSLRALVNLDLSCVTDDVDGRVLYGQILEAYARNAILYSDARRDMESDSIRETRFDGAMTATLKGLELVEKSAKVDEANLVGKPYPARIAETDALATQAALMISKRRLKALRED
jgi:hypothetical protein